MLIAPVPELVQVHDIHAPGQGFIGGVSGLGLVALGLVICDRRLHRKVDDDLLLAPGLCQPDVGRRCILLSLILQGIAVPVLLIFHRRRAAGVLQLAFLRQQEQSLHTEGIPGQQGPVLFLPDNAGVPEQVVQDGLLVCLFGAGRQGFGFGGGEVVDVFQRRFFPGAGDYRGPIRRVNGHRQDLLSLLLAQRIQQGICCLTGLGHRDVPGGCG